MVHYGHHVYQEITLVCHSCKMFISYLCEHKSYVYFILQRVTNYKNVMRTNFAVKMLLGFNKCHTLSAGYICLK